jgi:hypothetical protein
MQHETGENVFIQASGKSQINTALNTACCNPSIGLWPFPSVVGVVGNAI